jgi:hypothetical protein
MDTIGPLTANHVVGRFDPALESVLGSDPVLIQSIARALVESHFPATVAPDVLSAVGFDPQTVLHGGRPTRPVQRHPAATRPGEPGIRRRIHLDLIPTDRTRDEESARQADAGHPWKTWLTEVRGMRWRRGRRINRSPEHPPADRLTGTRSGQAVGVGLRRERSRTETHSLTKAPSAGREAGQCPRNWAAPPGRFGLPGGVPTDTRGQRAQMQGTWEDGGLLGVGVRPPKLRGQERQDVRVIAGALRQKPAKAVCRRIMPRLVHRWWGRHLWQPNPAMRL